MVQKTLEKKRLTPSPRSSLFTGDVLYMNGGKFENEDIRIHLEKYVSEIPEAEILLANKAKDERHCGMQSIVQIARGGDEKKEDGPDRFPVREYSPCGLVVEKHPLSKVIGHGTVSSSKTTNRLWNGKLAVEYDLVETDRKGRKYVFLDADELARTFEKRSAASKAAASAAAAEVDDDDDSLFDDIGNDDDAEYAKSMVEDLQRAVEDKQGPMVSGSKLLTELKILAEVFRAETERYEKTCCMDPVMRNLLLPLGHTDKPMFSVAFTTNIMCMGFKAIFYTTALQDLSASTATDVVSTEVLHSVQTELLFDAIPKIVNSVERAILNKVKYFKIDPRGTKNLSLPANTKNDEFAMPYHRFKVHDNGIVEISNKELVTTLGVKSRADVSEWMRTLDVLDSKCMCARAIDRSYEKTDTDEWVRRLLFSHIADALPFKNRTALVDLDYYVSGLCYNFLCSEYGMMITRDNNIPGHSSVSSVCLSSVPENSGGGSTVSASSIVINGGDASSPLSFSGALGDAATATSDSSAAAALADEQAPPVPSLDSKIRNLYDTVITSDKLCKVVSFLVDNENLGLITNTQYASTVIDILSAKNKPDKKALGDAAYLSKRQIIGMTIPTAGSMFDKTTGEYNCVAAIAVLQMVIRHVVRDLGISFGTSFLPVLSGLTFDTLDFSTLWMRTFVETRICPSVESDRAHFEKLEAARKKKKDVEKFNATDISNVIINAINNNTELEDTKRLLSTVIDTLGKDHDSSSFATNAFDQDTMFLWTIVTLAERFCQIYNAVNNPDDYYRELSGFEYEGGLEKFKKLCEHLKPELDVFVKNSGGKSVMVCREQFREAERFFESKKNSINRDLMLLKRKELYMTSANEGMSIVYKAEMSPDESFRYKSNTEFLVKDMFNVIKKEITAVEKKSEDENEDEDDNFLLFEEDDDDEEENEDVHGDDDETDKHPVVSSTSLICFNDDVVNGFFNRYSEVKSFTCRSALCHRQEFVSVDAVLVLDKFLSGYIVTPKVVKDSNNYEEVLKEVRERSARGHRWVVPFSFPVSEIKGDSCKCEKCVKLLCIPESNNLKQLVKVLRFNTMACERRFFTDASMSLGFVKTVRRQQQQHHFEPIDNPFDTKASKYCGYYNNVVKEQNGIAECLKPRFRAIYGKDYDVRQNKLRDHISFFTGLWAMASKANLEESVLTAVVSRPSEACSTLSQKSKSEEDDSAARRKRVKHAFDQIGSRSQTLSGSFLEMVECTRRINSLARKSVHDDHQYFLGLIHTYRDSKECNGTHLHTLFSNVKQCFDNSLPVDWKKLLGKNITRLFNVVKGAPNSDESGTLFECARFISRCARIMLGTAADSKLTKSLSAEEWEDLLSVRVSDLDWIHSLALDYESVMNVSDARTTENFINASAFLSGNDMGKHMGIKPTENEKIRHAPWSDTKKLTLEERVELLVAIEKSNRNMTFSTVLVSCALFRILVEGYGLDELPHCPDFDFAKAFIRSLTVINATRVSTTTPPNFFERCVEAKRFVDIDEDHSYFYKFAAYILGMLANDDQFFEDLTGTISEAFDFNGYDTRNWNDFIEKHFISFLLGRRAFLTSRPAAFIKRMVGAAHSGGSSGSEALSRLAKLVLIKSVDSDVISVVDLITCCLEDEKKDVDVKSVPEYYMKLNSDSGKKAQDVADASHNKTSNACSNEQLAKQVNASRIQDVRVGFHNKSQVNKIERDEEEEADLSYELYSETVEKAIVTSDRKKGGGGDDKVGVSLGSSSSDGSSGAGAGIGGLKKRIAAQRKHQELYDHNNTEETNGTFVSSCSRDGKESDLNLNKAHEFSDEDIVSANDVLVKKARVLMRQNKIKGGIRTIIDRMSGGMKVICPINSEDDPASHGLTRQFADRIVSAVAEWNEIVKRESEYFKKECQEIEKNGTYDMRVVLCQDYSNYQNSGYDDEIHVFKNDLFGDGEAMEERPFDNTEEKGGEKRKRISEQKKQQGRKRRKGDDANNDDDEHQPFNEGYGLKDMGDDDYESRGPISQLSGGKAFEMKLLKFRRTFTSNAQHVFVRRVAGYTSAKEALFKLSDNMMFDANMAAEFFDSKLVDTYFKETVPCLMNASSKPSSSADDEEAGKTKKKKERRHFGVSAFNVVRANDHLSRSEQYSNNHNSALISLYDNRRDDYSDITNGVYKEDVLIPIRSRSTASEDEMFSAVKNVWLCNSGIHPRDQVEMFKKLVFRNYNKIWIKMYCRFVDVLRKWGVLSRATIDQLFFSVKFNSTVTQIIDNNPPTSVLHSKFIPGERVSDKLLATRNLMYIREYTNRILSNTPADSSGGSFSLDRIDRHALNTSILCREFISGLFDARGDFSTSRFTNKGTMLFTPGTSTNSRDYEGDIVPDESFVGREQTLEVNSLTTSYSRVIEALRIGVFEPCSLHYKRILRLFDKNLVVDSGSMQVVSIPSDGTGNSFGGAMGGGGDGGVGGGLSGGSYVGGGGISGGGLTGASTAAIKRATATIMRDGNYNVNIKRTVCGSLTSPHSQLTDSNVARNMLMTIRRMNKRANGSNVDNEMKKMSAEELSLRYIVGLNRGFVFYGDETPKDTADTTYLSVLKKSFGTIDYSETSPPIFLSLDWLSIATVGGAISRDEHLASLIQACIPVDRRIKLGSNISFSDLAAKRVNGKKNSRRFVLIDHLSSFESRTGIEKRGVLNLANPLMSMNWFLMRARHLRMSCTNSGVASLCLMMCNRENKMELEHRIHKGLATVFDMVVSKNSCVSVDNNRFFLIGGSYLLGGRIEDVNLKTDMFVRCKLRTEKQIVHESLFDANVTSAFLATCIEGTSMTRGLSLVEHISRLVNSYAVDIRRKNYWSAANTSGMKFPASRSIEEEDEEESVKKVGGLIEPAVCTDDENYIFLRMLYSIAVSMNDSNVLGSANTSENVKHVAMAVKRSYKEVVNQENGIPRMHSLYHLKALMNFCGFVSGICTGDGEKAHHLMYTLTSVGLNMTPKTVVLLVGVVGNNLKSTFINVVKSSWWDMYTDLGVDALVNKGDAASSDAKLAYVAGKRYIFVMEEVGYQGSVSSSASKRADQKGLEDGSNFKGDDENPELSHRANNEYRHTVATRTWQNVFSKLKENKIRLFDQEVKSVNVRSNENGKKRSLEMCEEDEDRVSSSIRGHPPSYLESKLTSSVINAVSKKVSWWSHINGPTHNTIGRDKTINGIISNRELPFCISNISDSTWLSESDNIIINNEGIDRKEFVEDMRHKNFTTKNTFAEMVTKIMANGYNKDDEWHNYMGDYLLPPSSTSARKTGGGAIIYAMHAHDRECPEARIGPSRILDCPSRSLDRILEDYVGPRISKRCDLNYPFYDEETKQRSKRATPFIERTIAQVLHNPQKHSFPRLSLDGSNLFQMNSSKNEVLIDRIIKSADKNCGRVGQLFNEIVSISLLNEENKEISPFYFKKLIEDDDDTGLITSTTLKPELHTALNRFKVKSDPVSNLSSADRILLLSLYDYDRDLLAASSSLSSSSSSYSSSLTQRSNVLKEAVMASNRMNRDTPMTSEMLPGQVSSNFVKQVASTKSSRAIRGLHSKPVTCSVTATPVMISNSYVLKFFVDKAMNKRLLIFSCDTNFTQKNVDPDVEVGDNIIRRGLQVIHSDLLFRRYKTWCRRGVDSGKFLALKAKRINDWRAMGLCGERDEGVDHIASAMPSMLIKHVMSKGVLELSESSNLIKLEENGNSFFQAHGSLLLSSKPSAFVQQSKTKKKRGRQNENGGDGNGELDLVREKAVSHKQMCTINPKHLDTLQLCIDRSKSNGVWGLVNAAFRSAVFVDFPFVKTSAVWGEGSTTKLLFNNGSTTINWSSGLRLPDTEGIKTEGTLGIGDAVRRQLVEGWGSNDIRDIMYTCHHLHMMFELVVQHSNAKIELDNVGNMTTDADLNIAFMLACSAYIDMFGADHRFFVQPKAEGSKRPRDDTSAGEEDDRSTDVPLFMAILVNKDLGSLRSTTNLAHSKLPSHRRIIKHTLKVLGRRLNRDYLCEECGSAV